jgi:hypothetical protein
MFFTGLGAGSRVHSLVCVNMYSLAKTPSMTWLLPSLATLFIMSSFPRYRRRCHSRHFIPAAAAAAAAVVWLWEWFALLHHRPQFYRHSLLGVQSSSSSNRGSRRRRIEIVSHITKTKLNMMKTLVSEEIKGNHSKQCWIGNAPLRTLTSEVAANRR